MRHHGTRYGRRGHSDARVLSMDPLGLDTQVGLKAYGYGRPLRVRYTSGGAEHEIVSSGRAVTAHTPGGTGALRVAAEFIQMQEEGGTGLHRAAEANLKIKRRRSSRNLAMSDSHLTSTARASWVTASRKTLH